MNRSTVPSAGDDVGEYRILRRLNIDEGHTGEGDPTANSVGIALDVETTGLRGADERVIELAVRRFRFDANGVITEIGRAYTWREDPGRPLDPDIVRLTGLTDSDLVGHMIDTAMAESIIGKADLVVAHNAAFDRGHVDARLPGIRGLPWACSCREVDWPARGFDGRGLAWLLAQAGFFHAGHRAANDVDALIAMLRQRDREGRTVLGELVDSASKPSWIVRAVGAHFDVKDQLKARGYRWDAAGSVWFKEVRDPEKMGEEFWLAANVYAANARPRAFGPVFEQVDWCTRYS